MARDGSGVYTHPAGTTAVSGTTIDSTKYNGMLTDVAAALNDVRISNMTDVTAYAKTLLDDANAAAVIATLGLDADLATFSVPASTTISAFGATLVDDLDAAAARTTLNAQVVLSEGAFADGDKTKLDGIEALADVTDTANVTSAGALMDSELTNLAAVKAIDQSLVTTANPQFATLELGHASDTTISRTGAGAIAVEGVGVATASNTMTFTNKTFDANGTGNSISNIDVADLANGTDGELITWSATGAPATVSVGTANQVLTSNGAGAAPTFQVIDWTNDYVRMSYTQAAGTAGGAATSGAWRTYPINTEDVDDSGLATLATNAITLSAGTYFTRAFVGFRDCSHARARLYNTSDSSITLGGTQAFNHPTNAGHSTSDIVGTFTIASSKTFEIEYRTEGTKTYGLGATAGDWGIDEIYGVIEFWKIG
jgi:hypothetical protein